MLPPEVLQDITLRASLDPWTAHSLALVSHATCEWTKAARWTTIALTKKQSIAALARLLLQDDNTPFISVPNNPASYTRALFIEVNDEELSGISGEFLTRFSAVDTLALGVAELHAFGAFVRTLAPVSCSIVYDGTLSIMEHIIRASARLEYLHVVGIDPTNELAGVALPIPQIEQLCAASVGGHEALFPPRRPGVRHLRYDTRKFAFRPTDIMASRMYPFFQEPTVVLRELLDSNVAQAVDDSLRYFGAGRFAALEINWQTAWAPGAPASKNVREQICRMNSAEYTGNWPLELRGAWTDQTSSHRSSADAFRAEFVESITGLYGWHARPAHVPEWMHSDGQYIDRIAQGFTEHERLRLEELHDAVAENIGTADFQLAYRARFPAEFLHLGEHNAVLTREERLAHFYELAL